MSFKKFDKSIPRPKAYLLAGLRRPAVHWLSARLHPVGTLEDAASFLAASASGAIDDANMTVVDSDGRPIAIVSRRSIDYLVTVPRERTLGALTTDVSYEEHGFLSYAVDRSVRQPWRRPEQVAGSASVRPVTFDASVAIKGFEPELFAKKDVLFISAGLQLELALTLSGEMRGDTFAPSYAYRGWDHTVAVPFDEQVHWIYKNIVGEVRPTFFNGSRLSRTDLLCAATAIAYESPLYTTHPDDYESIGNGLRLVEYGPVRSKGIVGPPPAPDRPVEDVDAELRARERSGASFDTQDAALLIHAQRSSLDLTGTIADLLDDAEGDDASWRIGLLAMAPRYTAAVRPTSEYYDNLVIAVGNILNTVAADDADSVRLRDLAFEALGLWGRWPDDAADEVFLELQDEPDAVPALHYYRAYLAMAGVADDVADAEAAAVRDRSSVASRGRIEELR